MTVISLPQTNWLRKSEIFVLFFVLESIACAILPLSARSEWMSTLLRIHTGLTAAFLIASWLLRRNERSKEYWQVFYVLFVIGTAILVSTLWQMDLARLFGFTSNRPQDISMAMFFQSFLRVMVVLILMTVIGVDWQTMYLKKGNLRLGLAVGIPAFIVLAAIAFVPVAGQEGMLNKLLLLWPWILIFVLSNGFTEELLFRGLLLKRYEPFLGKGLSNLVIAAVFTLLHFQVTYVTELPPFLLGLFPLALIWGYLMQKTDSIWGSAIFHAGADCIIIFGVFASL